MAPSSNSLPVSIFTAGSLEAPAQSFAVPSRCELVTQARDLVHRFLGNPKGNAEQMCDELTDEELVNLIAAGSDRHTAVAGIKDVFQSAQMRKQKEHETQARADQHRGQVKGKASRVLAERGMPAAEIRLALAHISLGEQSILAGLDGETDIGEVVDAVLDRARRRAVAEYDHVSAEGSEAESKLVVSTEDGTVEPAFTDEQAQAYASVESVLIPAEQPAHDVEGSLPATEVSASEPVAEVAADPAPPAPPAKATPKPAPKKP